MGDESANYNLNLRDFSQNETILNGDIGTLGDSLDNSLTIIDLKSMSQTSLIDGFTISGAQADSSGLGVKGLYGGGILSYAKTGNINLSVRNCLFKNNYCGSSGGGIYNFGSTATASLSVENCKFFANTTSFSGAAIEGESGSSGNSIVNVKNTEFRASKNGNIRNLGNANSALFTCEGCLFSGNIIASSRASLINYNAGGNTVSNLINCTFSGNKAFLGAGVFNRGGLVNRTNTLFWNNDDSSNPDGIELSNGGTFSIKNSMIEGSSDNTSGNIPCTDPLFVTNLDPLTAPALGGNFSLQNCSPIMDKGLNDSVKVAFKKDLLGFTRIFNGSGQASAIVDLGAYEYQSVIYPVSLNLVDDINTDTNSIVTEDITANNTVINPARVLYQAGESILLDQGFEVENGSVFRAEIGLFTCP